MASADCASSSSAAAVPSTMCVGLFTRCEREAKALGEAEAERAVMAVAGRCCCSSGRPAANRSSMV